MSASIHLPILPANSLAAEGVSLNHSAISTALALLGWPDKHPTLTQAKKIDQALGEELQTAYVQYLALPDLPSRDRLTTSLTTVIDKLEKDRMTATRLAREASDRLSQEIVDYSNTGITSFIGELTTKLKIFFGSDNATQAEYYDQLAEKYSTQLRDLSYLRESLLQLSRKTIEIVDSSSHERRLLQTPNFTLPVLSMNQFCYPTGVCHLSILPDGFSGVAFEGEVPGDFSGNSVSTAGDINGDGISDIIVGAPYASSNIGKSYVVFGSNFSVAWGDGVLDLGNLMDGQRGFVLQGEVAPDQSGFSVSFAGDVNDDGVSDIILGAPGASFYIGKSYIVFGSRNRTVWGDGVLNLDSLMDGQHGFMLQGEAVLDWSGYSVSTAGDINGDGVSDIMIGAPYASSNAGKSYVVFGSGNSTAWGTGALNLGSLDGQCGFMLQGEINSQSGNSMSVAGDINGDGISDIIIGAPNWSGGRGRSYVVFGSRNDTAWGNGVLSLDDLMDGQRGFVLQGERSEDGSGVSVSTAGDINGDGLSDIIVGADYASPLGQTSAGKSYVVFGSNFTTAWDSGVLNLGDLMDGQRGFELQGEVSSDHSGGSVSTAGDINGDGISDIIVGANEASSSTGTGKSYVVFGSALNAAWGSGILKLSSLMNGQRGFMLQGEMIGGARIGGNGGNAVSVAGDINGDGVSDIIVGACQADPLGKANAGKNYVIFGKSLPLYFAANYLRIGAGETIQLSSQLLDVASARSNTDIATLHVSIENIENGYFIARYEPSVPLTNFYMQNISDGSIQFVHNGGALAPRYRVIVNSMLSTSLVSVYSEAQIIFLGYRPNLVNNKLSINQGMITIVDATDLSASDQDSSVNELSFAITNLVHGQFMIYNSTANTATNTTEFTQKAVLDRNVRFVHDGSRNTPSYLVTVNDAKSTTNAQAATITFNYEPEMNITSSALILDQGQATTLNPRDMSASDKETFRESLIIEATNVTHGSFVYTSNTNLSITAFQQFALITGAVQFVQDGSNSTPDFALRAFDGILRSPWQTPQLYLNHRPIRQGEATAHTVIQGEDFSFTLDSVRFSDPDVNDTLTYRAQLKGIGAAGGSPLPPEIQFTPPNQFSGNLPAVGSFNIEVEARDRRALTASTSFILSSKSSGSSGVDYKTLYTSFSSIAGVGVTVLAYLYLRRRIAKHRRDFPFANDLRKVLNLEYYDFTRFDGDSFKTKINDFLQRLQSEHQEFYTQLTPEEQNSFAVCVAEVLTKRGLVSRSSYGGGLFGILCFLNVGWPSELNLKAFEVQSWDIAAEAVTTWKNAAAAEKGYHKPLKRWPYYSPSKKEKLKVFCCCAKPSSADRWLVSEAHSTQGIALTELKKREGTDSALTIEPVAERKTSNEFEGRVLHDLSTLKDRMDALESRPLLQPSR